MAGETTSRTTSGGVIRFVPRMWREWARFIAAPRLPGERQPFGTTAVAEVGQLLALTIVIDLLLAAGLGWLAEQVGVKTPEFEELTRYGPAVTMLAGALGLPIVEECVFRGWLTGRRKLLALFAVLAATAGALAVVTTIGGPGQYKALAIVLLVALVVAVAVAWRVRGEVPDWFVRAFPWLFAISAMLFGLAHLSNYDLARPWVLLPFVIPQLLAGTIFGFARVRYGMWANIALHTLSNALFLGLTLGGV